MFPKEKDKVYNGYISALINKKEDREKRKVSYLAKQYYKLPLQLVTPFYQDSDGTVSLYLLNPSGGMLENDKFMIDIEVAEGASAHILTPSANKIYHRKSGGGAVQKNIFRVGKGSVLEYLPEEIIPFKNSSFCQETDFFLRKDSTLITWDILAAGRVSRREIFDFYKYYSNMNIYVDGELCISDRMNIVPQDTNVKSRLCMDEYLFLATVYCYCPGRDVDDILSRLQKLIQTDEDMLAGVTSPEQGFIVVKLMDKHLYTLHESLRQIWQCLRSEMLNKDIIITRKY